MPFVAATGERPGAVGPGGPAQVGRGGDVAVPILLAPGGSAVRTALFSDTERSAQVLGLDGVVPAGEAVQIARDSARLLRDLLTSLLLTFVLLAVGAAVGLRSARLGALAMLPGAIPCLLLYGSLAWWGRPVTVATAMIGKA